MDNNYPIEPAVPNSSKKLIIGVIVVLTVLVGGYFYMQNASNQPVSTEPIKLGFVGPLTGDMATIGIKVKNAVELAIDEINGNGGIKGRRLEVIYEDGKCSGKDALSAAQKLVNIDGVKIIFGGFCSGEALAILPFTESNKVITISSSATSPDLTSAGEYFFRNAPSDTDSGRALAELIIKDYKKVGIISENTEYAQALQKVFVKNFEELGGNVVVSEGYNPNIRDFRSNLLKIKAANPEAIFINPQTEAATVALINQINESGIKSAIYGNVIVSTENVLADTKENSEGIKFTDAPGLSDKNPKAVKFIADFKNKYGDLVYGFYLGGIYDDVYIIVRAVEKMGVNSEKIKNYLYGMENYDGVIGNYRFDKYGDITGIKYINKEIKNGKIVVIE